MRRAHMSATRHFVPIIYMYIFISQICYILYLIIQPSDALFRGHAQFI